MEHLIVARTTYIGRCKNTQEHSATRLKKFITFINFYLLFRIEEFAFFVATASSRKFRNKLSVLKYQSLFYDTAG